jgi:hypothetical protein
MKIKKEKETILSFLLKKIIKYAQYLRKSASNIESMCRKMSEWAGSKEKPKVSKDEKVIISDFDQALIHGSREKDSDPFKIEKKQSKDPQDLVNEGAFEDTNLLSAYC